MKQYRRKNKDRKGSMGIGALIVFIALVVVAAISAVVIINTAITLKNQAEKTGESIKLAIPEVKSVIGDRDPTNSGTLSPTVDFLYLTMVVNGAKTLNMTNMRIHITTSASNTSVDLILNTTALQAAADPENPTDAELIRAADSTHYSAKEVSPYLGSGWDPGLGVFYVSRNTTLKIYIDLRNAPDGIGKQLPVNTDVTITFNSGDNSAAYKVQFNTGYSYGDAKIIDFTFT
ncbi:MAG: hypothetical protein ACPL1Y_03170 [Thermoplasmata archaeon]